MSKYLKSKINEIEEKFIIIPYNNTSFGLCDDLVNDKIALDICKNLIDEDFIEETLTNENMNGFVLIHNNEYYGFVIFEEFSDCIEIVLIGSIRDEKTKGLPLGQYMTYLVQEEAKNKNIDLLYVNAIPQSLSFYLNNGWCFVNPEDEEHYFVFDNMFEPKDTYELQKLVFDDNLDEIYDVVIPIKEKKLVEKSTFSTFFNRQSFFNFLK